MLLTDYTERRLYWTDASLKHISSVNYDGTDMEVVHDVVVDVGFPFGIAVFEVRIMRQLMQ